MKGHAFSINVPGRNGYSVFTFTTTDDYDEFSCGVADRVDKLGLMSDPKDLDYAIVEEMTPYEISVSTTEFVSLDNGKEYKIDDVLCLLNIQPDV